MKLHKGGNLDDAETVYRRIIEAAVTLKSRMLSPLAQRW
jgi:hypothetical protein